MKIKTCIFTCILYVLFNASVHAGQPNPEVVKRAQNGDVKAQVELARAYSMGLDNVTQDTEKSYYWYTKAAEQGDMGSQKNLGIGLYFQAQNVKESKEALFWISKAAEQGDIQCQNLLGKEYGYGTQVPNDTDKALFWFTKSAEQGDIVGQHYACQIAATTGNAADRFFWCSKAANRGDVDSQLSLGMAYATGEGTPIDYVKAHAWLSVAIVNGGNEGQSALDAVEGFMTKDQINDAHNLALDLVGNIKN